METENLYIDQLVTKLCKNSMQYTLVRMSGEIPSSANERARNSTIGVLPLPPHVKFPTLITGTGNLNQYKKNTNSIAESTKTTIPTKEIYKQQKSRTGSSSKSSSSIKKKWDSPFSFPLRISNRLPVFLDDFKAVELVAGEGSQ